MPIQEDRVLVETCLDHSLSVTQGEVIALCNRLRTAWKRIEELEEDCETLYTDLNRVAAENDALVSEMLSLQEQYIHPVTGNAWEEET